MPLSRQIKMWTITLFSGVISTFTLAPSYVYANNNHNKQPHSPALTGFLGLNTVPSARMDEAGTLRAGLSTLDPYMHGFIGVQLTRSVHINVRQTAETSSLLADPDRLYPGIDLKFRLTEETATRPEISVGLQSAFGHKRMAGEYIALSKRYHNFDFTAGIGWGRFGSAGHIKNPFSAISPHFKTNRSPNSHSPNDARHWFTGEQVGFFGGVEYFLPFDGLSLKLDYGADRYSAEEQISGYKAPSPWGIGLSYTHKNLASASIGIQGTDKIMARLSLSGSPAQWPFSQRRYDNPQPFYEARPTKTDLTRAAEHAKEKGITLHRVQGQERIISADIELPENAPAPRYLGRTLRILSSHSAQEIEAYTLSPRYKNLRGPAVTIMRKDIEKALQTAQGSPQEIWNNTTFNAHEDTPTAAQTAGTNNKGAFLSTKGISLRPHLSLTLENQISLSEEDHGTLYRTSALIKASATPYKGTLSGLAFRVNLKDNLEKLPTYRVPSLLPVRSDIHQYAEDRLSIDHSYLANTHSFGPEWHVLGIAGYLDETHAGVGGEMLYRPFGKRYSLGAEAWHTTKRDPHSPLHLGLLDHTQISGFIQGWYDIPYHDVTLHARAGRFLAGDTGATIGLKKRFENGASLHAALALSNYRDRDVFGGTTHANHRLSVSLPLGSVPYIPEGSTINTMIAPFGRDIAQRIHPPLRLHEMTERFTLDHMAEYWIDVLK